MDEPNRDVEPESAVRTPLLDLLAAGMGYWPMRGQFVEAIANARIAVASSLQRRRPLDPWLHEELRVGGIRANAAAAATIEIEAMRDDVVRRYLDRYPDRAALVQAYVDALAQSG